MQTDDFLGRERKSDELERIAQAWREISDSAGTAYFDVISFVERTLPTLFPHFALIVRRDADLPNNIAITHFAPTRIEIRESVYRAAHAKKFLPRFQLTHEASHCLLHETLSKSLLDGKQFRFTLSLSDMSVENHADTLSEYLIVPRSFAVSHPNVSEIMYDCGVPYDFARKMLRKYGVRPKRKLQPYEVAHLLTEED